MCFYVARWMGQRSADILSPKSKKRVVMNASLNEAHEPAKELKSAFLAGPIAFEAQLAKLSDHQYVSLLTLLDEYSATL